MKKKSFTKLIAGTLSVVLVISQMSAAVVVRAEESGITAIGKQEELVIDRYTSAGVESTIYTKDGDGIQSLADTAIAETLSLIGTGTTTGGEESDIAPGSAYSVATAFDPDGDGVADWMARLSLENEEKGGKVLLSVSMASGAGTSPYVAFLNQDTGGYIDTTDDIEARAVEGLINVIAGDFDGDGKEELAVYAPNNSDAVETQVADAEGNYPKNQLSLKIYDMDFNLDISNIFNFHIKTSLPEPTKVIEVGAEMENWNHSGLSDNQIGDKQYYCIPYLSLMAEDVDGDGIDDLTTVANFSPWIGGYYQAGNILYLNNEYLFSADFCYASVMDIYTGSKSNTEFMTQVLKKKVLTGYDGSANDNAGTMFVVRNATAALGSVSDSNSREIIIAGNCVKSEEYDPSINLCYFAKSAGGARFISSTNSRLISFDPTAYIATPMVVLGCFTYEELVDKEINSLETVTNWDWTCTDSGYSNLQYCSYSQDTSNPVDKEIEPVAMVPFAAHGADEADSVFLEGQIFRYNTETKEFEDTGYTPAYPTNYSGSRGVWIGTAVASDITGSADGAETVYYTYYEKDSAGTANYCSVVGLWGEKTEDTNTYNSAVKSNTIAAFPMHVTLAMAEKSVTADAATAEIAFVEGELEEDGAVTLVEGGCTPKVLVTYNGKQLRQGKDYYVTYTDNAEAGIATAIITAMGDYTGTGTLYFEIKEAESGEDEGEVTYEVEDIETINADNRTWDSYASYYYYNQLDEAGKAFWRELQAVCNELLTTTKDAVAFVDSAGNAKYYTRAAKTNQLTGAQAKQIGTQFLVSNPQYYFLTNMYSATPNGNVVAGTEISYRYMLIEDFANGEERQQVTAQIEQKLTEFYEEIDTCGSDEEKVKKIHDLILENVNASEGVTIYDALILGESQCEGYAELFQTLATGAGISSLIIGDFDEWCHAWNMVNLNGSWYIIDTIGDDPLDGDGSLYYTFYLISDAEYDKEDCADSYYEPIPEATLSSGSTMYEAGTIQAAKGDTSTPKIVVDATSGSIIATITAKSTETIYYSLDGTTPGVVRGASTIYTEPIIIEDPCVIKAVAIRDGYVDNKVSVQTIKGIRFDGNGCDEGNVSSILYGSDIQITTPENGFIKEGYRFTGWNTAPDGTETSYEAGEILEVASLGDTFVLYAQWEEKEYSITYELNGGTENSSNPDSYKMSDETITLAEPEQTGYYFDGWYTDVECSAESKVTAIPGGSIGDITLYAKWTPYIYHVSFDANGGEGTMDKITNCEFGKTYTFPANSFIREGYTFVGWSNSSNGSMTIYADQSEFSDLYPRDNITVKMFAIWEKEGTENNPSDDTTEDSSSETTETPSTGTTETPSTGTTETPSTGTTETPSTGTTETPSTGTTETPSTGTTETPSTGTTETPSTGTTETPSTDKPGNTSDNNQKKTYSIQYVLSGGNNANTNPGSYTEGMSVVLATPSKTGCVFEGWYTDSNYTTKITKITENAKQNYVLYAKWSVVKVGKVKLKSVKNTKGKKLLVKYGLLKGVTGYEISYTTDKKMKKAVKAKTTTKSSYTIKKLKKKKTYYVRVRAYKMDSTGEKVYGSYSKKKKVKVTK